MKVEICKSIPLRTSMLSVVAVASAIGCSGKASETKGSEKLGSGSPIQAQPAPGQKAPLKVDGYEVVLADPSAGLRPPPAPASPRNEHLVLEPTSPDPEAGDFTLDEAVAGMPLDGQLVAEIATDLGVIFCDLEADRAPRTVANFIGLARGVRPFWDARAGQWVKRPFYRDLGIDRVLPEYLVQFGDSLGIGRDVIGYYLPDEKHPELTHDRAGLLCMASDTQAPGSNRNASQFFITDGPAPQLDDQPGYTVFGKCKQVEVVQRLARVPQSGSPDNKPLTRLNINRLLIRRLAGGAAHATRALPAVPPELQDYSRGASPGPGSNVRVVHPPAGHDHEHGHDHPH